MLDCTISVADNSFPGNKSLSSIAVYLQFINRLIRSAQDFEEKNKNEKRNPRTTLYSSYM